MTTPMRLPNGRYRGKPITQVPVHYLKWMVNVTHSMAEDARTELARRGTILEMQFEISGHAVDRASQRCLGVWRKDRDGDEGLYKWLHRRGAEALGLAKDDKATHIGIKWVFERDCEWPILKTVMLEK